MSETAVPLPDFDSRPDIRLIAADMDGTLLRSDDTVGDATLAEITRWRDDGVPFVLATGRPPRWMHRIRDVLGTGTAVCCNGAVLLDLEPMEIRHEEPLEPDVLRDVTDALRELIASGTIGTVTRQTVSSTV